MRHRRIARPFRPGPGTALSAAMLGAAALGAAGAANAQTAAPGVTTFDTVTVTATKTEHAGDEVPASVEVVGQEELDQIQPRTVDDILRTMPGVETVGGPRRTAQEVNIRGIGGQRVVVTVDGARQNFDGGHKGRMFLDPDLLKRVEVLKGGNSSIHGAGAIGGVVAFTTKDAADFLAPGETSGARAKFGFSTATREPLYGLTLFAKPLEGIDVLASGTFRRTGTMQAGGGDEIPNTAEDLGSALVKLGLDMTPHQRVEVSLQRTDEDGRTPINTTSASTLASSLSDRTTAFNNYTLNYSFDEPGNRWLDTNFVLYRSAVEVDERRVSDGRFDESDVTTTGFDLYNTSRPGKLGFTDHAITYGVEFFRDKQEGRRNGAARPEFPSSTADVLGLYVQDEIGLGHGITLTPAVRFDSYEQESDSIASGQSESQVSPRIGGTWQVRSWAQLYGNYGHGFRAPSLTELFVSGTHFPGNTFVPNPDLKPETSEGYEAGLRLKFDDVLQARDRVRFTASWYDNQYEDFIETIVTATTSTNTNITEASIHGFEMELGYDGPVLLASVGVSRIRGENDLTGANLDSIPADKAVVTVGARLAAADSVVGFRSEFVDEQDRVDTAERTGGYAVHGLFASWQPAGNLLEGVRVDAGIRNLFDKNYRRHQATLPEQGRDFYGAVSYTAAF